MPRSSSTSADSVDAQRIALVADQDSVPTADPRPQQRAESMSEMRRDPLTEARVIFAPERGERPEEFQEAEVPSSGSPDCPFCRGHEHCTPPSTLVLPDPDGQDEDAWSVRVVPNKYPAVSPSESAVPAWSASRDSLLSRGPATIGDAGGTADKGHHAHGLFQSRRMTGGHEVIVESPHHVTSLTDLNAEQATAVFTAYAERIRHWRSQASVRYATVFKNVGAAAGASLRHSHSQLIATDAVPPAVASTGSRCARHHAATGCCLQCDILRAELGDGRRIVAQSDRFVAYCPFASRLPYLLRIVPRIHSDQFEQSDPATLADLAQFSQRMILCMERLRRPAAYNYTIHTRPPGVADEDSFHWWMELFPRLTKMAGFEWASDCFINPVMPETAAAHLRKLVRRANPLRVQRYRDSSRPSRNDSPIS